MLLLTPLPLVGLRSFSGGRIGSQTVSEGQIMLECAYFGARHPLSSAPP